MPTDLGKCEGCKSSLRKDAGDTCTANPCPANNYLSSADGRKCVLFALLGCQQMDAFGWCNKTPGTGCPSGQTYGSGVCSSQSINDGRNTTIYPAGAWKCDPSCLTCSGTSSNQCLSCPSFFGVRQNGTTCESCAASAGNDVCLSCDTAPGLCQATFTKPDCGVDKC
jgi:hypothetical protein